METAVKERLIGAAVLVVLVVVVVPALLKGPRHPPAAATPAPGETRVVEIDLTGADKSREQGAADLPIASTPPAPVPTTGEGSSEPPTIAATPERAKVEKSIEPAQLPASPPAIPPGAAWAVQVAALSNRDAAAKMVADLKRRNYAAFVLEYRADGRVLYRVRVGPEAQRDRADAIAAKLKADGFRPAVVAHP